MRYLVLSVLASCLVFASASFAQVGNYTSSGTSNGTWNLTQSAAATTQLWQNTIEDSRWIITTWVQFTGTTANYFYSTVDKSNGVAAGPTAIGAAGATNFAGSVDSARAYRPGICWTYDTVVANNGAAIAICNSVGGGLNVVVHFLRVDPTTAATQPVWQEHPTRLPVNVSVSTGESQSPGIACLDSGDILVVWRDVSTTGTIGDVGGINPVGQTPNPNAIPVADLFVRRFQQTFAVSPAALPGMQDVAAPAASTINLTESQASDWFPDIKAGNSDGVYISWASEGLAADDIANLGANTGPKGGIVGAETLDAYVALVRTSGATGLSRFSAFNVSESSGPDNFVFHPVLGYNRGLNLVCVVWHDLTMLGGIGGNATLAATDTGQAPFPNEYDLFARTFNASLVPANVAKITATTVREAQVAVTGIDTTGWVIAWTETISATDLRCRQSAFDPNLAVKGGIQAYPVQSLVVGGPPPSQLLWSLSSFSSTGITVAFSTSGNPDNLRTGQPASVAGVNDHYLAVGTVTATGGGPTVLQVASFRVNDGNVVELTNLPNTITAVVTLRNVSPIDSASLNSLVISAPVGWAQNGPGATLPAIVPPGTTQQFQVAFSPIPGSLTSGPNRFTVAASGIVGTTTVTAASLFDVPVTGQTGDLAGVQVAYTINPSTFANGASQPLTLSVTVTNAGSDPLTSLVLTGTLPAGVTPASVASLTFTPSLSGQFIVGGTSRTFTATVNASASIAVGAYRPGITLGCNQGIRVGTMTVGPNGSLTVIQGTTGGGGNGGGLVNSGGGCVVAAGESGRGWGMLALVASGAMMSLCLRRRRQRA